MASGDDSRTARATARAKGVSERRRQWVEGRDPASGSGAAVGWFRRYTAADGQIYALLLTSYIFLTILPATLVMQGYLYSNPSAAADKTIARLGLHGATATLIRGVLTGATGHKLGATLIALGSVVFFGLGIGRVLQFIHARAWGFELTKAMRLRDQHRFFSVLLALLLMLLLYTVESKELAGDAAWIGWVLGLGWLAILVWFFAWAPRLLLHGTVSYRDLLPGSLFIVLSLIGLRIVSHIVLVSWLEWYGKYYGGLGIVMALFFWITIWSTCFVLAATLSPALAERRDARQARRHGQK